MVMAIRNMKVKEMNLEKDMVKEELFSQMVMFMKGNTVMAEDMDR